MHILVVSRKQFDVVVAGDDDLMVDVYPVNEPLVEFRGFPHRKTGSMLVFVESVYLVWLHHVDHHARMFVQGHIFGYMFHEPFEHCPIPVTRIRVSQPGLVVQSAIFSSLADPSIFIGCPPVRLMRL